MCRCNMENIENELNQCLQELGDYPIVYLNNCDQYEFITKSAANPILSVTDLIDYIKYANEYRTSFFTQNREVLLNLMAEIKNLFDELNSTDGVNSDFNMTPHDIFTPSSRTNFNISLIDFETQLIAYIKIIITNKYTPDYFDIFYNRVLSDNRTKNTLEQLGKEYNITRERIRQKEQMADILVANHFKHLLANHENILLPDPILYMHIIRFKRLLYSFADTPITNYDLIDALYTTFGGQIHEGTTISKTMLHLCQLLGFIKIDVSLPHIKFIMCAQNSQVSHEVANIMRHIYYFTEQRNVTTFTVDEVVEYISNITNNQTSREIVVRAISILSFTDEISDGIYKLRYEYLQTIQNQVFHILAERNTSLHIDEIVNELNKRTSLYKKNLTRQSISNRLSNDDRFAPIGKSGFWALESMNVETGTIVETIIKVLRAHNSPLPIEEIYELVKKLRPVEFNSINIYINDSVNLFSRFTYGHWGLSEWSHRLKTWNLSDIQTAIREYFSIHNSQSEILFSDLQDYIEDQSKIPASSVRSLIINSHIISSRELYGKTFVTLTNIVTKKRKYTQSVSLSSQIIEDILNMLKNQPNNAMLLQELIDIIVPKYQCSKATIYAAISKSSNLTKHDDMMGKTVVTLSSDFLSRPIIYV